MQDVREALDAAAAEDRWLDVQVVVRAWLDPPPLDCEVCCWIIWHTPALEAAPLTLAAWMSHAVDAGARVCARPPRHRPGADLVVLLLSVALSRGLATDTAARAHVSANRTTPWFPSLPSSRTASPRAGPLSHRGCALQELPPAPWTATGQCDWVLDLAAPPDGRVRLIEVNAYGGVLSGALYDWARDHDLLHLGPRGAEYTRATPAHLAVSDDVPLRVVADTSLATVDLQ